MLIAGACLTGCLASPGGSTGPGEDGSVVGAIDGSSGVDAAPPECGDGTGLAIMHLRTIDIPATTDTITLPALAVFSNTGTTTVHTGQLRIDGVSTIGSAAFAVSIAETGEELPVGEAHGFLDEESRVFMEELIEGFWSDQERPKVIGTISHQIEGGTFDATIDYGLGELTATVTITFTVGNGPVGTGGMRVDMGCF